MTTLAQDAPRRNNSRSDADDVEPILIAEWPLTRGDIARVAIRSFKGTWLIDIRKWFETADGQLHAGPKGISLSLKHLRRMNVALEEAISVAGARGLISADEESGQ